MKINYESIIEDTLVNVFGFKSFKGEQKQIILSVIQGDDSLVIMPTGGGKSLCCLLYTSPSPRDGNVSRMPSSA